MMNELPTVELRFNKRRQFVFVLMMFLMAAFYIWIPNSRRVFIPMYVRWGFFGLFAAVGMFFLVSVLFGKSYIKLMPHALEFRMFFSIRQIRWLDFAEMKEHRIGRNRMIGLNYVRRELKSSAMTRHIWGFDENLTNSSTLKFDKFRDLVFQYWQHAKQNQAQEIMQNPSHEVESNNLQAQFEFSQQLKKLENQDLAIERFLQPSKRKK
jgi:hypothetical protein